MDKGRKGVKDPENLADILHEWSPAAAVVEALRVGGAGVLGGNLEVVPPGVLPCEDGEDALRLRVLLPLRLVHGLQRRRLAAG